MKRMERSARELPVEEREAVTAELYERLHAHELLTPIDGKWSEVGAGVQSAFRACVNTALAAREEPPKPGYWPGTADHEKEGPIGDGTPHARMEWFWERMRPQEKLIEKLTNWNPISSSYRFEAAIADAFDKLANAHEVEKLPGDGQGHKLDRVSFLSGYIQAATLMLRGIVKPDNDGAITMSAERAWKATGRDTEREHEPTEWTRKVNDSQLRAAFEAGCSSEGTGTPLDFEDWQKSIEEWEAS
jgi:hypothetical protein